MVVVDITGVAIDRIAGTEGGKTFPLAGGLFLAGGVLNSIYSVGQAYDSYRYWNDYYRNTGVRPRYPFRAGQYDWMADVGHGMYSTAYWFKR